VTSDRPQAARAPKGERARLILDTAGWCYVSACVVVAANLWAAGQVSLLHLGVGLSVPSVSVLLYGMVSLFVPSLYAPGRLVFPLPYTLPMVYVAMMVLAVSLSSRIGSALVALPEPMEAMVYVARWPVFVESYVAGAILLLFVSRTERRRSRQGSTVDSE
jgi:hypothetical protein